MQNRAFGGGARAAVTTSDAMLSMCMSRILVSLPPLWGFYCDSLRIAHTRVCMCMSFYRFHTVHVDFFEFRVCQQVKLIYYALRVTVHNTFTH